MKTFTLYDPADGVFTGRIVRASADQLAANVPAGVDVVEGLFDRHSQRVDVVLLEASRGDHSEPSIFVVDHQPPRPSPDHEWHAENADATTRAGQRWRWRKKADVVQRELDEQRAKRFIADLEAAERVADRLSPAERAVLQRFKPVT